MKISQISFLGKTILHLDFSNIRDAELGHKAIVEAHLAVARGPRGVQLVITNFTNTVYDMELIAAIKKFAANNAPFIKAEAVVGLSPTQRLVLNAIIRMTGRNYYAAKDVEDAKRWLASQ